MSCSPFELKDYFLRELSDPHRREVEAHLKSCRPCRDELERLSLTQTALFSLRDEEIPQRIAFVSDKIFEPSPLRRWWSAFWGSSARLAFASAAMLSAALLLRPTVQQVVQVPAPATAAVQTVSTAEIQSRIDAAVSAAVSAAEARQELHTKQLVTELESARRRLLLASDEYDLDQKRARVHTIADNHYAPPPEPGDPK